MVRLPSGPRPQVGSPVSLEIVGRAPLDLDGGRSPTNWEFVTAAAIVRRAGIVEALSPHVDSPFGRPRLLTLEALFVAFMINALRRHHVGHLVAVVGVLNALDDHQREEVGISTWSADAASYIRTERLFLRVDAALEEGHEVLENGSNALMDGRWFANRLAEASCPPELIRSSTVAIDGTDLPTWARLHGDAETVDVDQEEEPDELREDEATPPPQPGRRKRKARVLAIGPDGRNVYTKDGTARAGHRSATASRPSGPYVGRETHLLVQARDAQHVGGKKRVRIGPRVPGLVRGIDVVPAGTHRGRTATSLVIDANRRGANITDVIVDGGYSLSRAEHFHHPLHADGVHLTFRPASHQWPQKPYSDHAILIGGQLFSSTVAEDLLRLALPTMDATAEEKRVITEAFDRRASYAYQLHAGPDADGYTRWRDPLSSGALRSRDMPETMRKNPLTPLVSLAHGRPPKTITVAAGDLPLRQHFIAGTSAHNSSMGRRGVVENGNSRLQGTFVDIDRGYVRLFGNTKILMVMGFAIAGLNTQIAKQFRALEARLAGRAEEAHARQPRRRRAYRDVVKGADAASAIGAPRAPPHSTRS